MSNQVRCKMYVSEKRNSQYPGSKPTTVVKLSAVSGDENKTWSKYTPSGSVELHINNPDAYDAFVLGEAYFVDFTIAPAKEADEKQPTS